MKFSLVLVSLIEAAKNGRGGKHGGVDLSNERYIWQTPRCIQNEAYCTHRETINASLENTKGSIIFGADKYKSYENSLFEIKAPVGYRVFLKLDSSFGFELEYHKNCAYDKLHIFRGSAENFNKDNLVARFCGADEPYDASGHMEIAGFSQQYSGEEYTIFSYITDGWVPPTYAPSTGSRAKAVGLQMWTGYYNTGTNENLIAVDFDQDVDGLTGFKLDWMIQPDTLPKGYFYHFNSIVNFAWQRMVLNAKHGLGVVWKDRKHQRKMIRSINSYFKKVVKRSKNNKKCQSKKFNAMKVVEGLGPIDIGVGSDFQSAAWTDQWKAQFSHCGTNPHSLDKMITLMGDLMIEYLDGCKSVQTWNARRTTLRELMAAGLTKQPVHCGEPLLPFNS